MYHCYHLKQEISKKRSNCLIYSDATLPMLLLYLCCFSLLQYFMIGELEMVNTQSQQVAIAILLIILPITF